MSDHASQKSESAPVGLPAGAPAIDSRMGSARGHVALLITLCLVYLLVWLTPPDHPFRALDSYLPLHSFLEFCAIAVYLLVFGVSWNA